MYLIVGQELRPQDIITGVVRFLIGERSKRDRCNVRGANKWDFAVPRRRVYLSLLFDRVL